MTRKFDDVDEDPSESMYDDDYTDSDYGSTKDDDESIDGCCFQPHEHITFDDVRLRPIHMKRVKIGDAVLCVFSNGAVRQHDFHNTTFGISLAGTPYRTFTLEYQKNDFRTYYIHELVWKAFHGSPPQGWEVRHRPEYTMHAHKMYSNALHHLTTLPSVVTKLI